LDRLSGNLEGLADFRNGREVEVTMHSVGNISVGVLGLIGLALVACGGSEKNVKDPSDVSEPAPAATEPTTAPAARGDEVGMQFEDKGESQKADRTPPPTPSYKPAGRGKQALESK
jgi:hypothetical protein